MNTRLACCGVDFRIENGAVYHALGCPQHRAPPAAPSVGQGGSPASPARVDHLSREPAIYTFHRVVNLWDPQSGRSMGHIESGVSTKGREIQAVEREQVNQEVREQAALDHLGRQRLKP